MTELRRDLATAVRRGRAVAAFLLADAARRWPCRPGPILALPLTAPPLGATSEGDIVA